MTVTKTRTHSENCDRYAFDYQHCQLSKGWAQLDTREDASYFGNWAHPEKLQIVSFAEGDVCVVSCESSDEFRAEIESMAVFYIGRDCTDKDGKRQLGTFRIDAGMSPAAEASWSSHGLKQYLA